jgi:hypothetical protein
MKWFFLGVLGALAGSFVAWVLMYAVAVVLELVGLPLSDPSLREPRAFQVFLGVWGVVALVGAILAIRAGRGQRHAHW